MSETSAASGTDERLLEAAQGLVHARRRSLLLVEDTAAHAALVKRMLISSQWQVEHVTCGSAALAAFAADPHRLVLLDLSLPDIDGLTLLGRFRALNPHAPIVVVTATDRVSVSVDAMRKGAWDYVVKEDPELTGQQIKDALERAWQGQVREAETRLLDVTHMLEALRAERLEAIEVIVRTVCHEVSNPLSGVVALSQMLQANDKLDVELQRIAEGLVKSAQQVREVVDKLKTISDDVVEFGGQQILSLSSDPQLP